MWNDKSLRAPFIIALCLNAGVISWIGALGSWNSTTVTTTAAKPPLPSRLIELEALPPDLPAPKRNAGRSHAKQSTKQKTQASQVATNTPDPPNTTSSPKSVPLNNRSGGTQSKGESQSRPNSHATAQGAQRQAATAQPHTQEVHDKASGKPNAGKQGPHAAGRHAAPIPASSSGSRDEQQAGVWKPSQEDSAQRNGAKPGADLNKGKGAKPGQAPSAQEAFGNKSSPTQASGQPKGSNRDWNFSTPVRTPNLPASPAEPSRSIPGAWVPQPMRRIVASPKPHHGLPTPPKAKPGAFDLAPASIGSHSERGNLLWPAEHFQKPAINDPLTIEGQGKIDGGGDGSGLLGAYFLGQNFEQPLFKRPDASINFDWTHTQVDPRLPRGFAFSVRWTGKITPRRSDDYTFYTASDDGVRLYIDGKLLIDDWSIHPASEDSAHLALQANHAYPIVVEYYEKNGRSISLIKLYWESPNQEKEYIPQSCFSYPKSDEGTDNPLFKEGPVR